MRKITTLVFLISLLVYMVSCGDSKVDRAISKVEKAIEKIEENKEDLSETDWENLRKEIEEPMKVINEAYASKETSSVTKLKIVKLGAKVSTLFAEISFKEIEKQTGISLEEIQKNLKSD